MSAESEWEVVTKDPWSVTGSPPKLTIYTDGAGRINAAADRALDEPEAVRFLIKPDQHLVGITPADDGGDALETYSVTRGEGRGGDVRPQQALERVGVDVDELEETQTLDFDQDGDVLVADCAPLLEDDSAATHTSGRDLDPTSAAEDESDESGEEFECGHEGCNYTSETERGRNIHETRAHADEEEELTPDDVELPGSLTEGDVHAVADFLDSLEDVAADFEVNEERAEKILRAYDCLDEVSSP